MEHTILDDNRLAILRIAVKMTDHIDGIVMEIGCFRGGSLIHLARESAKPMVYGFDTFEGLPPSGWIEGEHHHPGEFACSLDQVQANVNGSGFTDRVKLIKGCFPQSCTEEIEKVAFCHLDVDLEACTSDCLDWLHPRMSYRGIIVLDDYDWHHCPGVQIATRHFMRAHPKEYQLIRTVHQQALLFKIL